MSETAFLLGFMASVGLGTVVGICFGMWLADYLDEHRRRKL